jgi:hypothetical protein
LTTKRIKKRVKELQSAVSLFLKSTDFMDHHPQTPQDIVSFENSASQIVYKVSIIVLLHTYSEGLVKEQRHTFLLDGGVNSSNQSEVTLLY